MNYGRNDHQRLSRRAALTGTALALVAAATGMTLSRAVAQQKTSQADVDYQSTPKDNQRCEVCSNFQPPKTCRTVQGDISPNGWCQMFVRKA